MKRTLTVAATLATLVLAVPLARAQEMDAAGPVVHTAPDAMEWMDAPPILPPGAAMAVIQGDPASEGDYTLRLRVPAGYEFRPHTHPTVENVTIVSGSLHVGMGETMDKEGGTTLATGGFASIPAEAPHYAWATEPVEVQVHGMGPFVLTYVNPDDAPKAAAR